MKSRTLKFVIVSIVWGAVFVFAVWTVAGMLCAETKNYTDAAGADVTEVIPAEPAIEWDLVTSPVFAVPALILFFLGWIFVWRLFQAAGPPPL